MSHSSQQQQQFHARSEASRHYQGQGEIDFSNSLFDGDLTVGPNLPSPNPQRGACARDQMRPQNQGYLQQTAHGTGTDIYRTSHDPTTPLTSHPANQQRRHYSSETTSSSSQPRQLVMTSPYEYLHTQVMAYPPQQVATGMSEAPVHFIDTSFPSYPSINPATYTTGMEFDLDQLIEMPGQQVAILANRIPQKPGSGSTLTQSHFEPLNFVSGNESSGLLQAPLPNRRSRASSFAGG